MTNDDAGSSVAPRSNRRCRTVRARCYRRRYRARVEWRLRTGRRLVGGQRGRTVTSCRSVRRVRRAGSESELVSPADCTCGERPDGVGRVGFTARARGAARRVRRRRRQMVRNSWRGDSGQANCKRIARGTRVDKSLDGPVVVDGVGWIRRHDRHRYVEPGELVIAYATQRLPSQQVRSLRWHVTVDEGISARGWPDQYEAGHERPMIERQPDRDGHAVGAGDHRRRIAHREGDGTRGRCPRRRARVPVRSARFEPGRDQSGKHTGPDPEPLGVHALTEPAVDQQHRWAHRPTPTTAAPARVV